MSTQGNKRTTEIMGDAATPQRVPGRSTRRGAGAEDVFPKIIVPQPFSQQVLSPTKWAAAFGMQTFFPTRRERKGLVLDLGSGSGILTLLLLQRGCQRVHACDISSAAVAITRQTVESRGYATEVTVYRSNLYGSLPPRTRYDLIVTNPPSLSVFKGLGKRPIAPALFAAHGGRAFIDKTICGASKRLVTGGRMLLLHPSFLDIRKSTALAKASGLILTQKRFAAELRFADFARLLETYGYSPFAVRRIVTSLITAQRTLLRPTQQSASKYQLWLLELRKEQA